MCGGGLGKIFSTILSPIFGKQEQAETKVVEAPTKTDNGEAELMAQEQEKKKKAQAKGMRSNMLAGDSSAGSTGTKSLLGE